MRGACWSRWGAAGMYSFEQAAMMIGRYGIAGRLKQPLSPWTFWPK